MAKETINNLESLGVIRGKVNSNFTELYDADLVNLKESDIGSTVQGYDANLFSPDFYKYQIVRTVTSGNLTVALKNYLGDDPSVAVPVKVQIGGVVRTVTSALILVAGAGGNNLNLGSSELATKECDLFTYLFWYSTKSGGASVGMAMSRYPVSNIWTDFVNSPTNEKGILWTSDGINFPANTDPFTNIGRFNATLSASPFTWSIPATSVILNRPVYETRWLDAELRVYGSTGSVGSYAEDNMAKTYKISGDTLYIKHRGRVTNVGSWTGNLRTSLPFSPKVTTNFDQNIGQIVAQGSIAQKAIMNSISTSGFMQYTNAFATSTYNYSGLAVGDWISVNGYYEI